MKERIEAARAVIARAGFDALYVAGAVDDISGRHSANRRYLSGFTGSTGAVLVTATRAFLAVDFRYFEQGERESAGTGLEIFRAVGRSKDTFPKLVGEAGLAGKRIGLSPDDLTLAAYEALQTAVKEMPEGDRPTLAAAPRIVEELRRRKDAAELTILQQAIAIADRAMVRAQAAATPGMTEMEFAARFEAEVRAEGAEGVSFPSIVAGGPWGAMPHASPRPEPLRAGEPIVADAGALWQGYCSDLTRTFTLGKIGPKFREIYEIVLAAQQNAIERVEAGMGGKAAHELAFSVIQAHGYGEQFGHGLGHGVGLEVHEAPYLGVTSEDTLEDGMVFTIEPGIYIPGWGGVRIEDVVVLEGGRARVLSHAPKLIPAGVQA